MKCDDARSSLSSALDGEALDGEAFDGEPQDGDDLQEHLRTCGPCAGHLARLRRVRAHLRLESVGSVPDLAPAVRAKLVTAGGARRQRSLSPTPRWLPVAAAALVLVLVGVTLATSRTGDGPGQALVAGPTEEPGPLLVWTPGGLPAPLAEGAGRLPDTQAVTVVYGDARPMVASWATDGSEVDRPRDGFLIPLDVIAVDPATYRRVMKDTPAPLAELSAGEAVLGETSAALRRIGVGGSIELAGGTRLRVTGVVDDELIGGAEVVVASDGAETAGVVTARYLLAAHEGERAPFEAAVRALIADAPVRFRGPGETQWLRDGDAVLPQSLIKEQFGEFAYRPTGQGEVTLDPAWVAEHIVTADLPVLGTVRCHQRIVAGLQGAFTEMQELHLTRLVDPERFQGCWYARMIAGQDELSRHAWGVAFDLNYGVGAHGAPSPQDPRLVEVMARWGFTWGGPWLVPDPAHFEYRAPPRP